MEASVGSSLVFELPGGGIGIVAVVGLSGEVERLTHRATLTTTSRSLFGGVRPARSSPTRRSA